MTKQLSPNDVFYPSRTRGGTPRLHAPQTQSRQYPYRTRDISQFPQTYTLQLPRNPMPPSSPQSPAHDISALGLSLAQSKLRALLAAAESSDDDVEITVVPVSKTKALKPRSTANQHRQLTESGEDDDAVVQPRGRFASRMMAHAAPPTSRDTTAPALVPALSPDERVMRRTPGCQQRPTIVYNSGNTSGMDKSVTPSRPAHFKPIQTDSELPIDFQHSSQGLSVSPQPSSTSNKHAAESETDPDLPSITNLRFKERIERIRQERLEREAAETKARARQTNIRDEPSEARDSAGLEGDDHEIADADLPISPHSGRPARKAGKKALEEMNRETQRMARNMQLTHEARTRVTVSKATLFERFKFRTEAVCPAAIAQSKISPSLSQPPSVVSTPDLGTEAFQVETPPSSPPTSKSLATAIQKLPAFFKNMVEDSAVNLALLGNLGDLPQSTRTPDIKGKGKEVEAAHSQGSPRLLTGATVPAECSRPKRIRVKFSTAPNPITLESDGELEIVTRQKSKLDAIFDKVPLQKNKHSRSLLALQQLAQVKSPSKGASSCRGMKLSMTQTELQLLLAKRAIEQAKLERAERLEILNSQGIVVQMAEERMRRMHEVEDIVARAREEADVIKHREEQRGKKPKQYIADDDESDADISSLEEEENGGKADELDGPTDSEDEDCDSGSGDSAEESESDASSTSQGFIDSKVEESDGEQDIAPAGKHHRRKQNTMIVIEDEDEDDEADEDNNHHDETAVLSHTPTAAVTPSLKNPAGLPAINQSNESPAIPTSVLGSSKKAFIPGLPVTGPAGLGLTQIFAGTMDDEASALQGSLMDYSKPAPSVMPDFDMFPDPSKSDDEDEPGSDHSIDGVITDSQSHEPSTETQGALQLRFSQSQAHGFDSLMREDDPVTQLSEIMELSQDAGLQDYSPLNQRFVEPPVSTMQTVINLDDGPESPIVRRQVRLKRKADLQASYHPSAATEKPGTVGIESPADNGHLGARKREHSDIGLFDRKKSMARRMVEEQAEESEDEYAGLGGVDGGESDGEEEDSQSVNDMIDDEEGNDVDEAAMAAHYADRERAKDEKEVEKLFRDLSNGMLRRKRGAEYSLSDSDDGGEARRRMKRRQFAKMQRALFADERIKKFAEKPGSHAFLRTLEDRPSDDENVGATSGTFIDVICYDNDDPSDQHHTDQAATVPNSQPPPLGDAPAKANPRRTPASRRRPELATVRASLSTLLDEPAYAPPGVGNISESEEEDKENSSTSHRLHGVVDRISLKRASSSSSSSVRGSKVASAALSSHGPVRAPELLRRATTNSTLSTTSTASDDSKIKSTAGRRSGISGLLTAIGEGDRAAAAANRERRRDERKIRRAQMRFAEVGGLFSSGRFE